MSNTRKDRTGQLLPRRHVLRAALALSFTAFAAQACARRKPKTVAAQTTMIARGEKVETGSPIYDEYFDTVHELHVLVTTARLEQRDARSTLASMLDLLPTATEAHLLAKLKERAPSLPSMHLAVDDKQTPNKAKLTLASSSTRPDEATKGLITVIEATANASLSLSQRMGELPERAHRMHNVGATLAEGASKDFASRPADEQSQIKAELQAAQELLVTLAQDAKDISDNSHAFVVSLQEVLDSSGTATDADKAGAAR